MSENSIDKACEVEAMLTEAAINEQKLRAARETARLKYTGKCFYCETPLGGALRFCDADCRDSYDRETTLKQRRGGSVP